MTSFITERLQSLISKKIGAAVVGETVLAATAPEIQGVPTIVYIVIQGAVDAFQRALMCYCRGNRRNLGLFISL